MRNSIAASLAAGALVLSAACADETEVPGGEAAKAASATTGGGGSEGNQPPVIDGIRFEPAVLVPGRSIRAVVASRDPDGDPVYHSFGWTLNGQPVASRDADAHFPRLTRGDVVEVTVEAADPEGLGTTASHSVSMGNRPPRVMGIDVESETDDRDQPIWRVDPAAEDPDGERLAYTIEWFVNGRPKGEGETFPKAGLKRGDELFVRVTANDGDMESEPLDSARIEIGNKAPDIVSTPPGLDPSGRFVYQVKVEDPDRDRSFVYALGDAPEGMQIGDFNGRVEWTPTFEQAGRHPVEIEVDDRHGGKTKQRFYLTVRVEEQAPPANTP